MAEIADFRSQVSLRGHQISGWIEWKGNVLFRPTVGLFVDGRFERAICCRLGDFVTEAVGQTARWSFTASIDLSDRGVSQSRISLSCLEVGRELDYDGAASDKLGAHRMFDRLMQTARNAEPLPSVEGFLDFLTLPLFDQIEILYVDILGRGVDSDGLHSRCEALAAGRLTILDVRDQLICSEEMKSRRPPSSDSAVGHWCYWSGIRDVARSLFEARPLVTRSARDHEGPFSCPIDNFSSKQEVGQYLLRLVDPDERAASIHGQWLARQASVVARLDARRSIRNSVDRGVERGRIRSLLGCMTTGPAGTRRNSGIESRAGVSGVLAYGPYIRLGAGVYELETRVTVYDLQEGAEFTLEVLANDLIFGLESWPLSRGGPSAISTVFFVPPDESLLSDATFEIRYAVRGSASLEIVGSYIAVLRADADNACYPNVKDWLPFQKVGDRAVRQLDGSIFSAAGSNGGHIAYGPYAKLLPGGYELELEMVCDQECEVSIEILDSTARAAAHKRFKPLAGLHHLRLPFDVKQAEREKLQSGWEFRVSRHGAAGAIRLLSTRVKPRLGSDVELLEAGISIDPAFRGKKSVKY